MGRDGLRMSVGAGSSRFACGGGTFARPLGADGLARRGGTAGGGTVARRRVRLTRQRPVRGGTTSFAAQGAANGAGSSPRDLAARAPVPAGAAGAGGAATRALGNRPFPGRAQLHAGAARLGEPDRDRLLGRARPVLAFANVVHLLADEFPRLRAGGFSGALVLARPLDGSLFRHGTAPL